MRGVLLSVLLVVVAGCASSEESRRAETPPEGARPERSHQTPEPPVEQPEPAPSGDPIPERHPMLALGGVHTCALDADGTVRCWGGNEFAQLGDPALARDHQSKRAAPTEVAGLADVDVVAIDAGGFHTCALTADGRVRCWGHDGWGQSGGAPGVDRLTPGEVEGLDRPVGLACGRQHTCVRQADRSVVCFGDNEFGQLGDGTTVGRSTPQPVVDLADVVALDAGRDHTCALRADGHVLCWGAAMDGQLAREISGGFATRPVDIADAGEGIIQLAAGGLHTCALLATGRVRCFGANDSGQLGARRAGGQDARRAPADVEGLEAVTQVACGARFGCARHADGHLSCWGANPFGQLGDGTEDQRAAPVAVLALTDAESVACGARHACALDAVGAAWCWGANQEAQLGAGTNVKELRPVQVGSAGSIAPPHGSARRRRPVADAPAAPAVAP